MTPKNPIATKDAVTNICRSTLAIAWAGFIFGFLSFFGGAFIITALGVWVSFISYIVHIVTFIIILVTHLNTLTKKQILRFMLADIAFPLVVYLCYMALSDIEIAHA